jgi:hypothetical protein
MLQAASDAQRLLELRREIWSRRCRAHLAAFATEALAPRGETPARHHHRICSELEALTRREVRRLMILAPPGAAKSTYTSRIFPAWFMAQRPHLSVILVSHTSELSEVNSVHVQRIVRENESILGYGLASDARGNWETTHGGRVRAIGVGGAIVGTRADLIVVDDPIRGRAEAESLLSREHTWDWWTSDLTTRLKPDGVIAFIATPFHQDDLMGRLLGQQANAWRVLRMPAIAEADDALGRQEGEPHRRRA